MSIGEEIKENKKTVKLTDVVIKTVRHWPWIVASVIICVGLAAFYAVRQQPVFQRSAALVIKEDSQSNSISSQFSAFASMGMMGGGMNIRDEVNKLQSPDLMADVVERLGLNVNYEVPGRFRRKVMYGDSLPVRVLMPDLKKHDYVSYKLDITPAGDITLKDIRLNDKGEDFVQKSPVKFGQPIKTPVGQVTVEEGPNYIPGEKAEVYVSRIPVYKAASNVRNAVDISLVDQYGSTIEMGIYDKSIQRAEDIINTIIAVYNENWIQNRNEISIATTKFINDRLLTIEKELGGVDKDIADFQSKNLVPDVRQTAAIYVQENQAVDQRILDLNNRLQVTMYMRDYLADASHGKEILPANSGIGNVSIEEQIAEYNKKLIGRNRLAQNSSENHPIITNLDNELRGMRNAILGSMDNEIALLNTRIKNMQAEKGKVQSNIASAPEQANYLLGVGRQQKVKESLYLFLLQKREENELSRAFTAYNTEVIAKPYGEMGPSAPKKVLIVAFAFIIGLLIPFGVTFLMDLLNSRVRSKSDLSQLSVPLIGEIPAWKPGKADRKRAEESGRPKEVVVESGNRNVINDAFRVLRANLRFLTGGDDPNGAAHGTVLTVTSMHAGSGKSFVSLNLAISMALRDKRVLVVDGDLRHGSTSEAVGSPSKGISNYLNGSTDDIESLIVKGKLCPGADVLPVGQFPPNPTELLEGERFGNAIDILKQKYDYVLIDCPPVNAMADAKIIDKVTDRCLFVIRVGLFSLEDLPLLDKMYHEKTLKNMSLILNGTTDANGAKFGYADNYHSTE